MSIRLVRPSADELRSLAEARATDSLTYSPIGISSMAEPPPGYRLDRWSRSLGNGGLVFERAVDALRNWRMHEGAGLVVKAACPPVVDGVVAMAAPLPIGWVEVMCRVVEVVDEPNRFGFTYGTLPTHPEQGEESFTVVRADNDDIALEIVAASRPRHILARAVPPIARRLQVAAVNRYFTAMQSLAEAAPDSPQP